LPNCSIGAPVDEHVAILSERERGEREAALAEAFAQGQVREVVDSREAGQSVPVPPSTAGRDLTAHVTTHENGDRPGDETADDRRAEKHGDAGRGQQHADAESHRQNHEQDGDR
jgi:hypothetical protein